VHGPADGLAEDGSDGSCDVFFCFFFYLLLSWPCIIRLISIFFYFYILVRCHPYTLSLKR
jgi:hypothetical protein